MDRERIKLGAAREVLLFRDESVRGRRLHVQPARRAADVDRRGALPDEQLEGGVPRVQDRDPRREQEPMCTLAPR